MSYFLYEQPDGRVVLNSVYTKKSGTLIDTIEAPNWITARTKVKEDQFYHMPGYGWYRR